MTRLLVYLPRCVALGAVVAAAWLVSPRAGAVVTWAAVWLVLAGVGAWAWRRPAVRRWRTTWGRRRQPYDAVWWVAEAALVGTLVAHLAWPHSQTWAGLWLLAVAGVWVAMVVDVVRWWRRRPGPTTTLTMPSALPVWQPGDDWTVTTSDGTRYRVVGQVDRCTVLVRPLRPRR